MNNICLKFLLLLITPFISFSQKTEIQGILLDKNSDQAIDFANVIIEDNHNHRLLGYGYSNEKGEFHIEINKPTDEMLLKVTHITYHDFTHNLTASKLKTNLGIFKLIENAESLDAVVIKTQTSGLVIKQDTLQYKAKAYKTKTDAVAEDLLKKLPGISIDTQTGAIKVNGIDVDKILVNGEPLFQNNPKAALKTLPKEVIDQIIVTNTKTEEEEFTGSESSESDQKTINIILKKDTQKFGKLVAGYGTDRRYETSATYNEIKEKSSFNIIGFSNNINKNQFDYSSDDSNFVNNLNSIKTQSSIGLNYNDRINKHTKINTDISLADTKNNEVSAANHQVLLPNRTTFSDENSQKTDHFQIFRNHLKLTTNITPKLKLTTKNNLYLRNTNYRSNQTNFAFNETLDSINSRNSNNTIDAIITNITSEVNLTQKISTTGTFIGFKANSKWNNRKTDRQNTSTTIIKSNNNTIERNQFIENNRNQLLQSAALYFNYRFYKKYNLRYQYKQSVNEDTNRNEVLNFDFNRQSFSIPVETLNLNQLVKTKTQEHQLSYFYKNKKVKINTRLTQLSTALNNQEFNRNLSLDKKFNDWLFFNRLDYKINKYQKLNLLFRTRSVIPKVSELQNITDNTNPLRIRLGNPDLDRELQYNISIGYNNYNKKNKTYFFSRLHYTTTKDQIINNTSIDDDFVQTQTFNNNSNNYRISYNGNFVKDFKTKRINYSLKNNLNISYAEDPLIFNNVDYIGENLQIQPSTQLEFNFNDVIEITNRYQFNYDQTVYQNDQINNQQNTFHSLNFVIANIKQQKLNYSTQYKYIYRPNLTDGFNRHTHILNAEMRYKITARKHQLKLSAYNVLNQNNTSRRYITQSRISSFKYNVLKPYVLLSYIYRITP